MQKPVNRKEQGFWRINRNGEKEGPAFKNPETLCGKGFQACVVYNPLPKRVLAHSEINQ